MKLSLTYFMPRPAHAPPHRRPPHGFAGVVFLFWGRASLTHSGAGRAVLAGLAAALSFGVAANYAKRRLGNVEPLAVAAASQIPATLSWLPLAAASWPDHPIAPRTWLAAITLGVVCTAVAFVLYYRLIARTGPTRARIGPVSRSIAGSSDRS